MIPTFRQDQFVGCAIKSALAQTYPRLEVICADDASPDNTRVICCQFDREPRFRYVRNERNLGKTANYRRTLYHEARGDWVLNLDGDDYLINPNFVGTAMQMTLAVSGLVMVCGQAISAYGDNDIGILMNASAPFGKIMTGEAYLLAHPPFRSIGPIHMATLYKRSIAMKSDFYSLDTLSCDFDCLHRMLLTPKGTAARSIVFVDSVAGVWRQHSGNMSRRVTTEMALADLAMIQRVSAALEATKRVSQRDFARWKRKAAFYALLPYAVQLKRSGELRRFPELARAMAAFEPRLWAGCVIYSFFAVSRFLLRRTWRMTSRASKALKIGKTK